MSGASGLKAALSKPSRPKSVDDFFNSKNQIVSSHTSELVIALCGPIGAPIHKVAGTIKKRLEQDFGYQPCEILRLSEIIEEHKGKVSTPSNYNRAIELISKGNDLREEYGPEVLAELAINRIALLRQKNKSAAAQERYLPLRVCHIIDSIKNQAELDTLKLVYRDMLYFVGVYSPLPAREKSLNRSGMSKGEIYQLIDQDSGEELLNGQTVRDTFPQADFFLRVDADTDTQIELKVERLLQLILGSKVLTPNSAETAMYMAASAAGNSACLSRQVGASLTDEDGEVLSVGWNDVPKFGGSLYKADSKNDPNSEKDKRCWNLEGGICFNDYEKNYISELLVQGLIDKGILDEKNKLEAVSSVSKNSKVKDLIEFSRAIHAEMHAILLGTQASGGRAKGGKLFCTTYPCHSCARHIVAAGIREVFYIEPYRKSLAIKLHGDSITEDETDVSKVRILPYDGVSPSRYLKFFRVPKDSRKLNGKLTKIDQKSAMPRFDKTMEALPALEAIIIKALKEKKLVATEVDDA